MTGRRPLCSLVLAGCALATLAGCPAPEPPSVDRPPASSAAVPLPARETGASIGLPAYQGPPPEGPRSSGPVTRLRAAVDLTPAASGIFSRVRFAAAAPDGGGYVVLTPDDAGLPERLGTVSLVGGRFAVTASVPIPLGDVWGMQRLTDGRLALAGPLPPGEGNTGGYGFAVLDPRTGAHRTIVALPFGSPSDLAFGRSALGPDGRTMYLFISLAAGAGPRQRLMAVDGRSGRVLSDRDLSSDVAGASEVPVGRDVAGLVPRPGGGVTLVFDATPDATRPGRIPTVLTFDARLAPVGGPVRVTSLAEGARTRAVAAGIDGTVFLVVAVPGGTWILAVPDRGGAGPVLVQLTDSVYDHALYDHALVVEPAQVWALVPAPTGAQAVDLTTGKLRPPVDVGCPGQDVRAMFPAGDGAGALLIGECDSPRTRTQMLWIVGR